MKALLIYGMHLDDCPCYVPQGKWSDNDHHTLIPGVELNVEEKKGYYLTTVKCTCGFDEALKGEK